MGVTERLGEIAQKWTNNAANAAPEWARNAAQNADKWERNAKSAQAEQNYALGVQLAAQNQLRLKGLQAVTSQDYAQGVSGAQEIYRTKVSMKGNKWQMKFQPYAQEIDRVVSTLPAKVPGSPRDNVINRVVPIAEALYAKKVGGTVARTLGPTPVRSPFGR